MKHKRFAAFSIPGQMVDANRAAVDITAAAAFSKIKFADNTTADLVVTKTDATDGRYTLTATGAAQRTWPLGAARVDALFAFPDGDVVSSATVNLTIEAEITPLPTEITYPELGG